jgi:RecT family
LKQHDLDKTALIPTVCFPSGAPLFPVSGRSPRKTRLPGKSGGDRGEKIGAYGLIEFVDGTIEFEYMTAEQIERRRKHSRQPSGMLWTTFWEEGWRKTPIRNLFKRIPFRSRALAG